MNQELWLTIFIPTYNRAYCLPRALTSIVNSGFNDLEVLVIDDGSTDETADLIKIWIQQNLFPLRYFYQTNSGKIAAHNRAIDEARGQMFLTLDSDDSLFPNSIIKFKRLWKQIPKQERIKFSGISGLVVDDYGVVSGTKYPQNCIDANYLSIHSFGEIHGDKREITRTEVLRQFPYPRFPGERHIRDNLIFRRIAHHYHTRFVNLPIVIGRRELDGMTAQIRHYRAENPQGMRLAFLEEITLHAAYLSSRQLNRQYVRYIRYSLHAEIGLLNQAREVKSIIRWGLALPEGIASWLGDRLRWAANLLR